MWETRTEGVLSSCLSILFATFQVTVEQTPQMRNNPNADISKINDRFYVVGDWEDEFCDLTLDKFLSMTKPENLKEIITPKTRDEIAMELERFDENLKIRNDSFRIKKPSKFGFFRKIRSFLKYEWFWFNIK